MPDEPDPTVDGIERADQHVVYASNTVGIDSRDPATVISDDTTGAPLTHTWALNDFTKERERPQIGTATQHETGSVDGVIGWTRWAGGRSAGRYYDSTSGIDLSQGLELTADQNGRVVRFKGNAFNGTLLGSGGSLCAGSTAKCNASLTGFLAGDGASHLGLAYTLGNIGFDSQIGGTAAFAGAAAASGAKLGRLRVGTVKQEIPVVTETWARWDRGPAAMLSVPETHANPTAAQTQIDTTQTPSGVGIQRRYYRMQPSSRTASGF